MLILVLIGSLLFLYGSYGLILLWATYLTQSDLQLALKITAYGCLIIGGASCALLSANKWAKTKTQRALQQKHPVQPWLWRFDWVNGYSQINLSKQLYTLIFSLSCLSGTIPDGYPDHEVKMIIPSYSSKPGTIIYKIFIKAKQYKHICYEYDLPVFSTLERCETRSRPGYVIDSVSVIKKLTLLLISVVLLMVIQQDFINDKLSGPVVVVKHELGSLLNKKSRPELPKTLSANELNAITGINGATEFMLVARYKDLQQLTRANENGGDLYLKDKLGRVTMHHAVACHPNQSQGRTTQIVDYLLSIDSTLLETLDASGRSPLYWAINSACLEGVLVLLEHGATVSPYLIEAARRENIRLHSRDNFVKEAVLNAEKIEKIMQTFVAN